MPTTPLYGDQKVTTGLLPNVRQTPNATPDQFGAGMGAGIANFGAATEHLLQTVAYTDANVAANKAHAEISQLQAETKAQFPGKDAALKGNQFYKDGLDRILSQNKPGALGQGIYDRQMAISALNSNTQMYAWEKGETKQATGDDLMASAARHSENSQSAMLSGNPAAYEASQGLSEKSIRDHGALFGQTPEVVERRVLLNNQATNTNIVQTLQAGGNFEKADAILMQSPEHAFNPETRAKLLAEGYVRRTNIAANTGAQAAFVSSQVPGSDIEVNQMAGEAAVNKIVDPVVRTKAQAKLEQLYAEHESKVKNLVASSVNDLNGVVDQQRYAQTGGQIPLDNAGDTKTYKVVGHVDQTATASTWLMTHPDIAKRLSETQLNQIYRYAADGIPRLDNVTALADAQKNAARGIPPTGEQRADLSAESFKMLTESATNYGAAEAATKSKVDAAIGLVVAQQSSNADKVLVHQFHTKVSEQAHAHPEMTTDELVSFANENWKKNPNITLVDTQNVQKTVDYVLSPEFKAKSTAGRVDEMMPGIANAKGAWLETNDLKWQSEPMNKVLLGVLQINSQQWENYQKAALLPGKDGSTVRTPYERDLRALQIARDEKDSQEYSDWTKPLRAAGNWVDSAANAFAEPAKANLAAPSNDGNGDAKTFWDVAGKALTNMP